MGDTGLEPDLFRVNLAGRGVTPSGSCSSRSAPGPFCPGRSAPLSRSLGAVVTQLTRRPCALTCAGHSQPPTRKRSRKQLANRVKDGAAIGKRAGGALDAVHELRTLSGRVGGGTELRVARPPFVPNNPPERGGAPSSPPWMGSVPSDRHAAVSLLHFSALRVQGQQVGSPRRLARGLSDKMPS